MESSRNGCHRGGCGGSGGNRTQSNGSSNSSSGSSLNRPTLKHSTNPKSRAQTPSQGYHTPARADSPLTPIATQSSFTFNGDIIHETYKGSTTSMNSRSSPQRSAPSTPRGRGNQSRINISNQRTPPRPMVLNAGQYIGSQYETKIKLWNLPCAYHTKEVYDSMSSYGTVYRIEMIMAAGAKNAFVIFRPPLTNNALPQGQLRVGNTYSSWNFDNNRQVNMIPSPINPTKSYQEIYIVPATSITFGIQMGDTHSIAMRTIRSPDIVQLTLNLLRKELDIYFSVRIDSETRKIRFQLPFALLSRILKLPDIGKDHTSLILPFASVPQFFVRKAEGALLKNGRKHTSFSKKDRTWLDWETWFRETDVVTSEFEQRMRNMPLMNHKDTAVIDLGRWTVYHIVIDQATSSSYTFKEFLNGLTDHGITLQEIASYTWEDATPSPLSNLLQDEITGTQPHLASTSDSFDDLFASKIYLPFPVRYQLEACLSNGYIKEQTITEGFLTRLAGMDSRHAIAILEKVVDKQHIYYNPMEIFNVKIRGSLERKVLSYCILQRSVIITPTMMHVSTPVMETSNRIFRKYASDADRFIRVKFSDEKTEGLLHNMPNDRAEAVFDRVQRAMKHGIVVAGRYYEFLAFGNSQFREHGTYFYAPTQSTSANDIRASLGQFDHIKTVAKFGARLGQCFSTTRLMHENVKIRGIPDITRNNYSFSDGVGKISLFLAQMAAKELGLSNAFDDPPSLFQFRLGGCKGVLTLDPRISGAEVHIRPSQEKFPADYRGLEIIRSSALATPFFNRQIIIVLSDLGISNKVFMQKQQDMINDYELAMVDETVALGKLRKHIDMNQTTITMAAMILDGFMKSGDPFLMSLLGLWRACTIKNLKEKARIAIDDGAFVLGCVDETATLKGHFDDPQSRIGATLEEKLSTLPEIFLQVDNTKKKGHYKIVEGVCILARNPSLHPGDLRIVRAVNVPALHHLKNVVVLPQTGDRDLANMCSGGDLDGDDYMVLWDPDLIPPKDINIPPMDFTAHAPLESSKPITIADVSEFFVTYMQNDSLGQIAHAHLAQADYNAEGVKSDVCLDLARLHSQAVDYPKSGIPAIMGRDLRPPRWPHFMEKRHVPATKIYKSQKILGQLYDHVQLVDFKPQWSNTFDDRILGAFELDKETLGNAANIKISYDEALKRLMAKHGVRTEFEAWSVFVLQHNHESRDYKFAEEFGRTIEALKAQFRDICIAEAGVSNVAEWSKMAPFVAAMYTVTAEELKAALEDCNKTEIVGGGEVPVRVKDAEHMPLISFPWLFAGELGRIANKSSFTPLVVEPIAKQERPRHSKKHPAKTLDIEAVGTAETSAGITHYGELLSLDFGTCSSLQQFEPRNTPATENTGPHSLESGLIDSKFPQTLETLEEPIDPPSVKDLPSSEYFKESPKRKEDPSLAAAPAIEIKLDINPSSAMDCLMRFE